MKNRPFSRGFSIVAGILFLMALGFSLLGISNFSRFFSRNPMVYIATTIAVWASWIVLAVAMFMRSGIVAGIGFTLQAVARIVNVIYYAIFYYPYPGYYFRSITVYPNLVMLVALILLTIACFRRKMGIPMACISLTLIYAQICFEVIVRLTVGRFVPNFITIDQLFIAPITIALSMLICAYSLFTGTYLPGQRKV